MTRTHRNSTRREFLTTSAATAGALSLGACAGPGGGDKREIPKAPDKSPIPEGTPVRIGLIGTGGMGGGHLGSMMSQIKNKHAHFEVVALADVNSVWLEEKAKTARANQSGVQVDTYADYRDLLAREDLDGVLIAAPEHWHAQMAMDAIAAGKDVYCEKPMTTSIEEAVWMMDTMDANPHMRLQVGTQKMVLEKYKKAKELIAAGEIGHPTLSQTSYCRNTPAGEWNYYKIDERVIPGETLDWEAWCGSRGVREWDPKLYHRWRRYKDFSTGIIGDLLVHMMTPMMYALDRGWPTRVAAIGGHFIDHDMENHDQVFLNVGMEKDHTMIVAGSTINATGLPVLIRGNRANILLGSNNCEIRPEHPYAEDIEPRTIQCKEVHDQPTLRLDWINCIRTREQNISQVDLAAKVMVAVDLSTKAMWDGGTWTYDPQTREYARE
jgi:predicted dehydrogenase